MTPPSLGTRLRILVVLLAAAALAFIFWPRDKDERWMGYVEGEALNIAAPVSGTLSARSVERGQQVKAGDALFTLDPQTTDAETLRLQANVDAARAQLADLEKERMRAPDLAAMRARTAAAQAEAARADKDFARIAALNASGFATRERLDAARAARDVARASVVQMQAETASGALTAGRSDELDAAQANVAAAQAALAAQKRRRAEISPRAPGAGMVEQTYFNPGEWVPANMPVLSIIPADRRKIRFFVPQSAVARLKPGMEVRFDCDGCGSKRRARISYVAPRAEFTPPVVYSERARAKLVFLVEAALAGEERTLPLGLPVDVEPVAAKSADQ